MSLKRPQVMGILNITPDSFYTDSRVAQPRDVWQRAESMLQQGASFLDVGAYSSRPGAEDISQEEEWKRLAPILAMLAREFPHIPISVDTFRSSIARQAVAEGARMINDISGGNLDPNMFSTIARLQVPYVLMHMRGTPQTMTSLAQYENITREIIDDWHPKIHQLNALGVSDILLDPGFGFAKTPAHSFSLLQRLEELHIFERPLLVGLSRKSMIWRTLQKDPERALNGTTALHAVALLKGASILRVHDVAEAMECITLLENVKGNPYF